MMILAGVALFLQLSAQQREALDAALARDHVKSIATDQESVGLLGDVMLPMAIVLEAPKGKASDLCRGTAHLYGQDDAKGPWQKLPLPVEYVVLDVPAKVDCVKAATTMPRTLLLVKISNASVLGILDAIRKETRAQNRDGSPVKWDAPLAKENSIFGIYSSQDGVTDVETRAANGSRQALVMFGSRHHWVIASVRNARNR